LHYILPLNFKTLYLTTKNNDIYLLKMKNKFDLDFNVLCRLCLHKGPELRSIFDCDFSYRIESCVGIVVSKYSIEL